MLTPNFLNRPNFWQIQLASWLGFYLLLLCVLLPEIQGAGMVRGNTVYVGLCVAASFLLRPLCRRAVRLQYSWLMLELRAFGWSFVTGAIIGLLTELAISDIRPVQWSNWLISWLQATFVLFLWCSLYFSIKQARVSEDERQSRVRAESELRHARLLALRYQLTPHFLFNSLNAVSTLVVEGNAPAATRMLSQIADLLRTTLDSGADVEVALAQELNAIGRYLEIEAVRFGERLHVEYDVDESVLPVLVPTMILQPLIENAIVHGIAPMVQGGLIQLRARRDNQQLEVTITNSGARVHIPPTEPERTGGIGLANTRERIETLHGANGKLQLYWPEQGGCRAVLTIPLRYQSESQR
jgi:hypothetical protein